jgi:glucosamine--fructose-6-phosphate aminotransferase (isomerizing)
LPPRLRDRRGLVALVVERDQHGGGLHHQAAVRGSDLVLHHEALRPHTRDARSHFEGLPEEGLRSKVNLDPRHDHRQVFEPVEAEDVAEVVEARRLQKREVPRVVDVPGRVEVVELDLAPVQVAVAVHPAHGTFAPVASGDLTRAAIFAQPEWLEGVPERVGARRLPEGRVVFTGCGTSFHAAQTGGEALQALEAVLAPPDADLLVALSHEGGTAVTLEAAKRFDGPVWLITGKDESPLAEIADEVLVVTPAVEESYCHTASYTCAVAALAVLRGEDASELPHAVAGALEEREPAFGHDRVVIAGAGRDWPTAQEAALKLREGAYLAAEAHHTEQLLHGHLAAIDENVRAFVFEGEGPAADRAAGAARALGELGVETTVVPSRHPVVDIVRFQLLTLAVSERRGVNPDLIRWDDPRWDRARQAYG